MIRRGPSGQSPGGHIGASVQEVRTGWVGCDHGLRPVREGADFPCTGGRVGVFGASRAASTDYWLILPRHGTIV